MKRRIRRLAGLCFSLVVAAVAVRAQAEVRQAQASPVTSADDRSTISSLITALGDEKQRYNAMVALGRLRATEAVEPLLALLKTKIWDSERVQLLETLGEIGDVRAVEPLLRLLPDSSAIWRSNILGALAKIPDRRVVEPVLAALKDPRDGDQAAWWFRGARPEFWFDTLLELLADSDPTLRQNAGKALERMTGKDLAGDASAWRRWWAARKSGTDVPAAASTALAVSPPQGPQATPRVSPPKSLRGAASVTGTLMGGGGKRDLVLAKVRLMSLNGGEIASLGDVGGFAFIDTLERVAVARTDLAGRFEFTALPPGRYAIGVVPKGAQAKSAKLSFVERRGRRTVINPGQTDEWTRPVFFDLDASQSLGLDAVWEPWENR